MTISCSATTPGHRSRSDARPAFPWCAPVAVAGGRWRLSAAPPDFLLVDDRGQRLRLNAAAAVIWQWCVEGICPADMVWRIRTSLDDPVTDVGADVQSVLARFLDEKMVEPPDPSPLFPGEIPVRIITLGRDPLRRAHVDGNLVPRLGSDASVRLRVERFDAVDGAVPDAVETASAALGVSIEGELAAPQARGQAACLLSHLSVLTRVAGDPCGLCVVLEDDAAIEAADPGCHLTRILADLSGLDWDLVLLYVYEHHYNARRDDADLLLPGRDRIMKPFPTWCTVAYLVNAEGARRILDASREVRRAFDLHLQDLIGSGVVRAYYARRQVVVNLGQKTRFEPPRGGELPSNVWSFYGEGQ